ncbi:MAG: CHAP domain-containing protein [Thermogemmatispora sp.]|uniref:CHAP domain-containing protein n=1 Tax=Thermogemmatispora sp. TaxID=1968838 RepID=UPI00261F3C62|nr:CHAP domain-containing protein [Thermogemmatispora sp.]MBX5456049.1 CHAP domain-containing protein [Thermogemmatispora sp.]
MLSFKDRQDRVAETQERAEEPIRIPGLVTQLSPVEQLAFPAQSVSLPGATDLSDGRQTPLPEVAGEEEEKQTALLPVARAGEGAEYATPETGQLPELQTALLPLVSSASASTARSPLIIRGDGKKALRRQDGAQRLPRKRWHVHAAVLVLVALILTGTLLTVLPESPVGARSGGGLFQSIMSMIPSNSGSSSTLDLAAMRAATATAIVRSGVGYDPGPSNPTGTTSGPVVGSNSGDPFPYGQCTYWADYRYHQLTGVWVPWGGNADEWVAGARANGWIVSTQPHIPSIVVLMPGVQGANIYYGHVAVAESLTSDGGVYTSNMNWYANGGGWGIVSYYTFYPGSGVYFVWI